MKTFIFLFLIVAVAVSCDNTSQNLPPKIVHPVPQRKKPAQEIQYQLAGGKAWSKQQPDSITRFVVCTINRTDFEHLQQMDSIIVPNDSTADRAYYMPFPMSVPLLEEVEKIIFFSYATQAFGAYEYGQLVYTGATNMGRKKDPTPTGLFFTNWKAEETTSSFDDEWELRWNFNVENKEGVGWHQYTMPGYPASHSCMRLQEADAEHLYSWADQWVVKNDTLVEVKGTAVVIFGAYNFDDPVKPWKRLVQNPHALDLPVATIEETVRPFMPDIMAAQSKRKQYEASKIAKR